MAQRVESHLRHLGRFKQWLQHTLCEITDIQKPAAFIAKDQAALIRFAELVRAVPPQDDNRGGWQVDPAT